MKRKVIHLSGACLLGFLSFASAQSGRPGWGSIPYSDAGGTGVTFRVWAPLAASVNVAGSFNGWSSSANVLVKENPTSGVWSVDVAAARANHNYKYVVNGSLWRSDPRGRIINSADNGNSVVVPTNGFDWGDDSFGIEDARDLVIYEAHVGTFAGPNGTFSSFTNRLDYLADLGVNAIELMPINEYPTATSWGYNPAYPFALESDYGSPDALKSLVRQAHEHRMQVLLDVVHNHWDGNSSLWAIDGTTPGPYFYASDPYANTWWGPRPDYGRPEVREYIDDNFRMWLDEYHLGGFRWDTPEYIFFTTNGMFIADGWTMVAEALDQMAAGYSNIWNIAENGKEYIENFDAVWDLTFCSTIRSVLTKGADSNRDMNVVASNVAGSPGRILYTDSHDTAGDLNGGTRLPTAISGGSPTNYYARKRSALGAVLAMTTPGTPMILQGQELLETNQFSDTRSMDWTLTNRQAGTWRLYRDLIRLRRNLDGVSSGLLGEAINVYQVDNTNKLIAYGRQGSAGTGGTVAVVANFANAARTGIVVRFPAEGMWYAVFNGDSTNYAADYGGFGSLDVAASGSPAYGVVDIGPYSAIIFSQTPITAMLPSGTASVDQPAGNGDGLLDPGETIREQVVLWNKSTLSATNVSATLASLSPGVSVVQGESEYDAMAPEGQATNRESFVFRLDPSLACGSVVYFQIVAAFNGQARTNVFSHVIGRSLDHPPATNDFGVGTPTPIPDVSTVYSELTIDEADDPVVLDIDVWMRIEHTYDWDLTLALQHPDGTEVLLVNQRGGSDDNFGTGECGSATYAVLDQAAAVSIAAGSAPFAGSYRPETTLNAFNGKSLNGTWRLRMKDAYGMDSGTNLCWGIRVTYESQIYECNTFSNHAPVARSTNLWLSAPGSTNFALDGSDEDGQPLDFQANAAPVHGIFTLLSPASGQAVYAPVHGYVGTDTVDFVVSDGFATSGIATVTLVVPPPEDINANGLPDDWEIAHYTNLTSALPEADSDGDGICNRAEYLANTDPWNSNSGLHLLALDPGAASFLRWSSIGGTRYRVEINTDNLLRVFQPLVRPLAEEVDPAAYGASSTMSFEEDASSATNRMRIYRIRVLNK